MVWKRSSRLAVNVCGLVRDWREWGLRDQIMRSAVSVASNIAEGAERGAPRDFARFLNIARGSAAELRTQLYIAREIGLIDNERSRELISELKEISSMLYSLASQQRAKVKEEDSHFTLHTSHSEPESWG